EDTGGIELVAAQFGHQAASGVFVKSPVGEFLKALIAELLNELGIQRFLVGVVGLGGAAGLFLPAIPAGKTVVAMPLGPDVLDRAKHAPLHEVIGIVVEHVVMPLMADGQKQTFFLGLGDHFLALSDRAGHQFFGED